MSLWLKSEAVEKPWSDPESGVGMSEVLATQMLRTGQRYLVISRVLSVNPGSLKCLLLRDNDSLEILDDSKCKTYGEYNAMHITKRFKIARP